MSLKREMHIISILLVNSAFSCRMTALTLDMSLLIRAYNDEEFLIISSISRGSLAFEKHHMTLLVIITHNSNNFI